MATASATPRMTAWANTISVGSVTALAPSSAAAVKTSPTGIATAMATSSTPWAPAVAPAKTTSMATASATTTASPAAPTRSPATMTPAPPSTTAPATSPPATDAPTPPPAITAYPPLLNLEVVGTLKPFTIATTTVSSTPMAMAYAMPSRFSGVLIQKPAILNRERLNWTTLAHIQDARILQHATSNRKRGVKTVPAQQTGWLDVLMRRPATSNRTPSAQMAHALIPVVLILSPTTTTKPQDAMTAHAWSMDVRQNWLATMSPPPILTTTLANSATVLVATTLSHSPLTPQVQMIVFVARLHTSLIAALRDLGDLLNLTY